MKLEIKTKLIKSPFRDDKNPTCSFYYSKSNRLYLHDFATEEHIDIFEAVKKLFRINYAEAIKKIISDKDRFEIDEYEESRKENKIEFILADSSHLDYFNRYHITRETLLKYNVYPAKTIYMNEEAIAKGTKTNPIFCYLFPSGNIKTYRPLTKDKSKKWAGNSNAKDIAGLKQLPKKGKILFVTSSLKDVMTLHTLGYNAIAFNGEGYGISGDSAVIMEETLSKLEKRFEYIIFYMDNDAPGINFGTKLHLKYNKKFIYNPATKEKDLSDFVHKEGIFKAKRLIKKLLSKQFKTKGGFLEFVESLNNS